MQENSSKSSWDDLANELGAEPNAEASERRQPPPTEIPSATSSPSEIELPKSSPKGWDTLAEVLGLEVSTTPQRPAEQAPRAPAAKSPEAKLPPGRSGESQASEQSEDLSPSAPDTSDTVEASAESIGAPQADDESALDESDQPAADSSNAARSAFDALFSIGAAAWSSTFSKPATEEPPTGFAATPQRELFTTEDTGEDVAGEESSDDQQPKSKSRRSRRRRRGGDRSRSTTKSDETVVDESSLSETDHDGTSRLEANNEESSESEGDGAPMGKKRRRRRSRRRPRSNEEQATANATDEASSTDGSVDHDSFGKGLAASENSDEDSPSRTPRKRSAHQNLPTWAEAIGVIVDSNLEQRTKAPSKSNSSRGRGGRGGRGRGRKNS